MQSESKRVRTKEKLGKETRNAKRREEGREERRGA